MDRFEVVSVTSKRGAKWGEGWRKREILTLDAKMKRLASSFVQVIRCGAHVLPGATPGHALKYQALIRPDYPGRRVVRQYLVLKTTTTGFRFSHFS